MLEGKIYMPTTLYENHPKKAQNVSSF